MEKINVSTTNNLSFFNYINYYGKEGFNMNRYPLIKSFIYEFLKNAKSIQTIKKQKTNKIVEISDNGILVETESSRKKYENREASTPYQLVKHEEIDSAFEKIIAAKRISANDLKEFGYRSSFLIALFRQMPFVDVLETEQELVIKQFTTLDLPSQLNTSLQIIVDQIVEKEKILQSPFFQMVYEMLKVMKNYDMKKKRETLLEVMDLTVTSSTSGTPITESVANRKLSDTLSWLKHFGFIDNELNVVETRYPRFWWVNQGKSYKEEMEGGFLWAPKTDKRGIPRSHHTDLLKARKGDIVFAYSRGSIHHICVVTEEARSMQKPRALSNHDWDNEGILLKVQYYSLEKPIEKTEIPLEWRHEEKGPFDKDGDVKMGYFFPVEKAFVDNLFHKFSDRLPEEIKKAILRNKMEEDKMPIIRDASECVNHIIHYLRSKGFYYKDEDVKNFYLSLKTKPFVVLSGISGTGKTKMVRLFAESLGATTENHQFQLIPVRPDWSDGSDLIGYVDIKGEFIKGPLTEILMEANKPENRNKPYFVLLDEMNLARVEHYFSDLLSIMETRKKKNGEIVSDPIIDRPETGRLILSDNVYIIGTVNMDETTHPFSKKVLDRANTIEYNEVRLDYFDFLQDTAEVRPIEISNDWLRGRFLTLKDAYSGHEELIHEVTEWLVEINRILEEIQAQIAYRVRDEICFYMIYNEESQLLEKQVAFDYQIMQKILPRIAGSDQATIEALKKLFVFCTNHEWNEDNKLQGIIEEARFPKSAKKIDRMIRKNYSEGFTSFWL